MQRMKAYFRRRKQRKARTAERDARVTVLEELFNDLYDDRRRIYKMNFVRGLFFGTGSAIGGTIIIALIVWMLSLFVNVPFIGETFQNAQESIEQTTTESPQGP